MTAPERCAAASAADDEPVLGTAPGDERWLLVEHPGPWGPKAVRDSGLPPDVVALLDGLSGVRVQLVRRPDRAGRVGEGTRVVAAVREPAGFHVTTAVLPDLGAVADLDPGALAAGRVPGGRPTTDPLWLVCTHGRRDVCCAELGRPVVRALADRWPDATWETTHLGGHRLAGTLLALPSGVALGRLDAPRVVEACAELEAGRVPDGGLVRGDAGRTPRAQAALDAVRRATARPEVGGVRVVAEDGDRVEVATADGGRWRCVVTVRRSAPRRASCGDAPPKPVDLVQVEDVVEVGPGA